MDERKLALILSILKENPNPKYKLEQYSITPEIASQALLLAKEDIKNKVVFDFGCGSGRFAIGASLLGAKLAIGVDVDKEVLEIAKENVKRVEEKTGIKISERIKWICKKVENLDLKGDTVIQFPPMSGNVDLIFLEKAMETGKKVYSFHKGTEEKKNKIEEIVKKFGGKIKFEKKFKYKLPWMEKGKFGYELSFFCIEL